MKRTKTLVQIGVAACALSAANAFAFFGTEIENYKPNPWLERPFPASTAAPEASAARESETERAFREMDLRSRWSR